MTELDWLTARPIAHRGLHDMNDLVWENTLPAYQRAIDRGYTIECDVRLTSDGGVVSFHDNRLERLAGTEGFVWQRTLAEMSALKIGTTQESPPSLRELLAFVDGRVPLIIEIKGRPGHDEGLVRRCAALLKDYRGKVALMSFDHWIIRQLAQEAPGIACGLTAEGKSQPEIEGHFSMLAHGISFVSYDVTALPNPFVAFVRDKLRMPVITWTVRTPEEIELTRQHADQITFEGIDPADAAAA
ncbi:MAG: glycerophosphodiester phosphodiesterase [Rhizobiaceae bacterium]|nr:glycerophosphodiester phosphodiesterase [Rhizobiaceae bacterium]